MKLKAAIRMGLFALCMVIGMSCKDVPQTQMVTSGVTIAPTEVISPPVEQASTPDDKTGSEVYICKSKGAKRYHYKESCHGLKRCKQKIEKVSVKEAEGFGLTPCGHEK